MHFKRTPIGIDYLYEYYPLNSQEHDADSQAILRFKQGNEEEIERFANEIKDALIDKAQGDADYYKDFVLVLVPSHRHDEWSQSLLKLGQVICRDLHILNYSRLLRRGRTHEKLSVGGNRSVESHLNTIEIGKRDISGKSVIILDDVTTTGNSILACAKLLKKACATKVGAIVIGKTTR